MKQELKDGEPCNHRACLAHITHPCEGCGRIGGYSITAKEIVKSWLKNCGFDGLYCSDVPCGCGLDDLMPCGEFGIDCIPAFAVKGNCSTCKDQCEAYDEGNENTICYTPVKPIDQENKSNGE